MYRLFYYIMLLVYISVVQLLRNDADHDTLRIMKHSLTAKRDGVQTLKSGNEK